MWDELLRPRPSARLEDAWNPPMACSIVAGFRGTLPPDSGGFDGGGGGRTADVAWPAEVRRPVAVVTTLSCRGGCCCGGCFTSFTSGRLWQSLHLHFAPQLTPAWKHSQ